MAEAIADGIRHADPKITVKLYNASKSDKTDIVTEVFRSRAIIVGSPTVNNGYLYAVAGILEMLRGMKFKNKKAAAFGSYGWSGEAVKMISEELTKAGFTLTDEGFRTTWVPDNDVVSKLREYGTDFVNKL